LWNQFKGQRTALYNCVFVLLGGILRRPWERARWFDRAESRRAVGSQVALRRSEQQQPRRRQGQSRADGDKLQPAEAVASAAAAVVAGERSDSNAGGMRPASAKPKRRPASAKPMSTRTNPSTTMGEARRQRGEWRENGRPTSAPLRRSVRVSDAIAYPSHSPASLSSRDRLHCPDSCAGATMTRSHRRVRSHHLLSRAIQRKKRYPHRRNGRGCSSCRPSRRCCSNSPRSRRRRRSWP
jgi:hypothetical protein